MFVSFRVSITLLLLYSLLHTGVSDVHPYEGAGELALALSEFDEQIIMEPSSYSEVRMRPMLEERLESIISGAALMADSSCTRDERRERIVAECNAVRQALQVGFFHSGTVMHACGPTHILAYTRTQMHTHAHKFIHTHTNSYTYTTIL